MLTPPCRWRVGRSPHLDGESEVKESGSESEGESAGKESESSVDDGSAELDSSDDEVPPGGWARQKKARTF